MKGATLYVLILAGCCPPAPTKKVTEVPTTAKPEVKDLALPEEVHLKNLHQLTFGGDNAEAYWSFGGDRLILQTNHAPYKCDQIEVLSLKDNASKLVSTGKGRTTCSYFLKGDQEIIYASTHESSPECPTPPDMSKGYLWGLFDYDIYKANADGSNLRKLTNEKGYDAEATVCPVDGSIVFTSTRSGDLELWRMDADGGNLRQLTNAPGYDGGAFFSADCSKIVWRSSRPAGQDLEEYKALLAQNLVKPTKMDLYVANADGSDARQVTYLPGASFAPFFFPNGKRIIFASNYLNPKSGDFDLFAIDIDGSHLERITYAARLRRLPDVLARRQDAVVLVESPRRHRRQVPDLGYAGRAARHQRVRRRLGRAREQDHGGRDRERRSVRGAGVLPRRRMHARVAASAPRGSRTRRTPCSSSSWPAVSSPGSMASGASRSRSRPRSSAARRRAWRSTASRSRPTIFAPIAASANGSATGTIISVGWGIVDADVKLDEYKGKSVKGKVVLVHRFVPPDAKLDPRATARLGDLRFKAFLAKNKGAVGMIVVDDGDLKQEEAPLPKLAAAESESAIPVVVMTRKAAAALAKGTHKAKVTVGLEPVRTKTANLVGVIHASSAQKLSGVVVIGAHLDHLGMGGGSNALDPNVRAVHNGADDNASGVAALVEVARVLAEKKAELRRDVYIVAFSAEEMGDLGSDYYVKHPPTKDPVFAMINMDMVGRMRMNQLHVNGGESAKEWRALVEPACQAARLECTIGGSGYGPSDHMPFYVGGRAGAVLLHRQPPRLPHRDRRRRQDQCGRRRAHRDGRR